MNLAERMRTERKEQKLSQEEVAQRLRVLRARRGETLAKAAKAAGIGRDTLAALERGRRHPGMPTLAKIAAGYGIPVEDLLEEPVPLGEAPEEAGPAEAGGDEAATGRTNELEAALRSVDKQVPDAIGNESYVIGPGALYKVREALYGSGGPRT